MSQKWRPPLSLVIAGTLAGVLSLPIAALFLLRALSPHLGWTYSFAILGTGAVLATALLGYLLRRLVQGPVYRLTTYARALRRGETAIPPQHYGTPELQDLGRAVIDMGATLEGRATQLRAYADHVTHELRSPLTALRGSAELLESASDDQTRLQLVQSIQQATTRMERLLDDLHDQARASQSSGPGQTRLRPVAEPLGAVVDKDAVLPISVTDLEAILSQLIQNARTNGASEVRLSANTLSLEIVDNGTGILEGNRARIFDPFFTTRRESGGTGMGLSIVRSLCQANGAEIDLIPSDKGAHFRITFPA